MKKRVLFVDDEPKILDGLRRMLRIHARSMGNGSLFKAVPRRWRYWESTGST